MIAARPQIQQGFLSNPHGKGAIFDSPVAFNCLIFLTFIMFLAPQAYFTSLMPLRLALVSALISMVAYVAATMSQRGKLTVGGPEVKLMLCLVAFALISIPHSRWAGGSFELFYDSFLKVIIVFFLIANLLTSERRFHTLLWALAFYSAVNAITGINGFRHGNFSSSMDRIYLGGNSPLTSNPNDLALTLNLLIPFIGYLFLTSKTQLQKIVAASILTISVVGVIVSYSRGGALTLLSILLWYIWRRSGPQRIGAVIAVTFLIGMVVLLAPGGYTERIASTADFSQDQTGSAEARWMLMKDGLRQTFEHPLGIGLGMNNLLNLDEGKDWTGVHNVYLQISTELGIFPGILFIILLWKLIAGVRRIKPLPEVSGERLALLAKATECSLIAFAVAAMFHPVAYNFYFYILAGIAVALKEIAGKLADNEANAVATTPLGYRSPQLTPIAGSTQYQDSQQRWRST